MRTRWGKRQKETKRVVTEQWYSLECHKLYWCFRAKRYLKNFTIQRKALDVAVCVSVRSRNAIFSSSLAQFANYEIVSIMSRVEICRMYYNGIEWKCRYVFWHSAIKAWNWLSPWSLQEFHMCVNEVFSCDAFLFWAFSLVNFAQLNAFLHRAQQKWAEESQTVRRFHEMCINKRAFHVWMYVLSLSQIKTRYTISIYMCVFVSY